MKTIYFFGNQFNGLEFVTYILIPSAIVLVILVYIYFNIKLLRLTFDLDLNFLKILDDTYESKLNATKKNIEKYNIIDEEITGVSKICINDDNKKV